MKKKNVAYSFQGSDIGQLDSCNCLADGSTMGIPRRPSHGGCAISHRLKWAPLPPNDVDKFAQHISNED